MTSGKNQVETPVRTTLSPASRALWAFVAPLLGGLFLTYAATQLTAGLTDTPMSVVPFWAGLGLTSLFMGMRW
jgi:hypothetical protein